ncbi:ROK family protein [Paenibacillus macerans]|uniref:ROK family protein n=1 Tax=Paenibacillus macerans TaxID=44252 RepID=A0A6N8ETT3_PAEMA|nr:ROK family protein [Paenibacillus macerans]MBS5913551.1 ROK family protein [Paenibacillus macerans]MEC0136609.1 ROK family protein [Paenibacillus macerans]MUG22193.1 ROK family protein [Paenibacillus macerans]UMV48996.1 ROK family protein [Paenibacillus macerans]GIP12782.1 glucokinase [Paenibacillus macerans]
MLLNESTPEILIAGIDVGGTKTLLILSDLTGKVLSKRKIATSPDADPDVFFQRLIGEIEAMAKETGQGSEAIAGMGFGFPGVVDEETGVLTNAPAFPWVRANVKESIRKFFKGPLYLDNDVNVAAMGEKWRGAAAGAQHFLMVTVGTGIGGALVLNDELYKGSAHSAGELGYFVIEAPAPESVATQAKPEIRFGHFEQTASGTAIGQRARQFFTARERKSPILDLVQGDISRIDAKHVLQAAAQGDEVAWSILEEPVTHMAIGIANAISILNPALVVIGGGVAEAGNVYLDAVRSKVRGFTPIEATIVPAKLGNEAGAIGAVAGAVKRLKTSILGRNQG